MSEYIFPFLFWSRASSQLRLWWEGWCFESQEGPHCCFPVLFPVPFRAARRGRGSWWERRSTGGILRGVRFRDAVSGLARPWALGGELQGLIVMAMFGKMMVNLTSKSEHRY